MRRVGPPLGERVARKVRRIAQGRRHLLEQCRILRGRVGAHGLRVDGHAGNLRTTAWQIIGMRIFTAGTGVEHSKVLIHLLLPRNLSGRRSDRAVHRITVVPLSAIDAPVARVLHRQCGDFVVRPR